MGSLEQKPQDNKPEDSETEKPEDQATGESKPVAESEDNTRDGITDFLKQYFDLSLNPGIPSSLLTSANGLFPLLEANRGFLMQTGGVNDLRRQVLYKAGMPQDLLPVDIYLLTATAPEDPDDARWGDFAFHISGVFVDPSNKEHGWSGRAFTISSRGNVAKFSVHLWEAFIHMRGSTARMLIRYNTGANPLFNMTFGQSEGETIHFQNVNRMPTDEIIKLSNARALLDDLQATLDLAVEEKSKGNVERAGRKPKVVVDDEEIPAWSFVYDEMATALDKQLEIRYNLDHKRGRYLSKYSETERAYLIKRVMPHIPQLEIQKLAVFDKVQDVALNYAGWSCSEIPIGTWNRSRYRQYLQESDRINNITRDKTPVE